ncbi:MAG: GspE/PulE family protein [Patescibacteria group bacterium]
MALPPVSSTTPNHKRSEAEKMLEKKLEEIRSQGKGQASHQLANSLGLSFSDLHATPIDVEALVMLDKNTALAAQIAIIYRNSNDIIVAALDPTLSAAKTALAELEKRGFRYKVVITTREALEKVWARYGDIKAVETFEIGAIDISDSELDQLQQQITDLNDLRARVTKISATKLLEIIIAGALKTQASDIHFEPESAEVRLRYRLDGLLHDITNIQSDSYGKILNRVKVLSKLKLNVHKSPQDGRFTIRQKSVEIEVRVSILPSEFGETIVMRLLDPRSINANLEDLGMRADILELVRQQLKRSTGAILTTGPTGAGKTTTLYAFVNFLNSADAKIITIEDPIEYHIQGISQTQIDAEKGYTFANGLRAIVRQDPDIILVGEIRDEETAEIALNASLTGHLVFSTIHTNDAAGTIPRLIDLGIRPQVIAPAINMAMGQRLLRRLCKHCKIEQPPSSGQLEAIKKFLEPIKGKFTLPPLDSSLKIYFPSACAECNGSGYKGRVGVYEIFTVTKDMERLVMESPTISDVRDLAVKEGMVTMTQDGYLKLLEGTTSIEEIERVLG